MRLTVATMVYKPREDLWDNIASMVAGGEKKLVIVENGCRALHEEFQEALRICNQENVGVTVALQQVLNVCDTEFLALLHDDVRILDPDWGMKVIDAFDADPLLGHISFFGCPGLMSTADRGGVFAGTVAGYSNMPDAHIHGMKRTTPRAIAVPDSFSLIYRTDMLREFGFDMRFSPDHCYDYQLALQFLAAGYHNLYLPIPCTHVGNITRNDSEYSRWVIKKTGINDYRLMKRNTALILQLWGPCLPLYVNEDFSIEPCDPLLRVKAQRSILGYQCDPPKETKVIPVPIIETEPMIESPVVMPTAEMIPDLAIVNSPIVCPPKHIPGRAFGQARGQGRQRRLNERLAVRKGE